MPTTFSPGTTAWELAQYAVYCGCVPVDGLRYLTHGKYANTYHQAALRLEKQGYLDKKTIVRMRRNLSFYAPTKKIINAPESSEILLGDYEDFYSHYHSNIYTIEQIKTTSDAALRRRKKGQTAKIIDTALAAMFVNSTPFTKDDFKKILFQVFPENKEAFTVNVHKKRPIFFLTPYEVKQTMDKESARAVTGGREHGYVISGNDIYPIMCMTENAVPNAMYFNVESHNEIMENAIHQHFIKDPKSATKTNIIFSKYDSTFEKLVVPNELRTDKKRAEFRIESESKERYLYIPMNNFGHDFLRLLLLENDNANHNNLWGTFPVNGKKAVIFADYIVDGINTLDFLYPDIRRLKKFLGIALNENYASYRFEIKCLSYFKPLLDEIIRKYSKSGNIIITDCGSVSDWGEYIDYVKENMAK